MKTPNEMSNPCLICQAVCCQRVVITLKPEEKRFLEKGGTSLVEEKNESLPFGVVGRIAGLVWHRAIGTNYHMDHCGYLRTDEKGWRHCSVHDDPSRPEICKSVRSGGSACRSIAAWQKFRNME